MSEMLRKMLVLDEGKRNLPYEDSVGILTIGVGRNLEDVGLRDGEIMFMLQNDIDEVRRQLNHVDWYKGLNLPRQHVIENMVFNLGWSRFMKFKKTIAYIIQRRWNDAALEMLRSVWAAQVGPRAIRLSNIMKSGMFGREY